MRTRYKITALIAGLGVLGAALPASARINQRQTHQQQRIANGLGSGRLSASEAARLERQQAHIARYEARSRADGYGLSRTERARVEAMQDRASRHIYYHKHD